MSKARYVILLALALYIEGHLAEAQAVYDEDLEDDLNTFGRKFRVPISKERCTRRFAPGKCMEAVNSVWTFVAHLQNCTERLGCRVPTRSNRFPSYHRCMRNCRSFILDSSRVLKNSTEGSRAVDDVTLPGSHSGTNASNVRRGGIHLLQPKLYQVNDWQAAQHDRAWYYRHLVNADGDERIGDERTGDERRGDDIPLIHGRDVEELEEIDEFRLLSIDDFNEFT